MTGAAKVTTQVLDFSTITAAALKGVTGVIGSTERGPVGTPVLIGTWDEFTRNFGGLLDDSVFPLLCRRALERGGRLRVSRVAHYDDIDDSTSLVGDKATGAITVPGSSAVPETRATSTLTVGDVDTVGDRLLLTWNSSIVCQVDVDSGETLGSFATKIIASINAGAAYHGFQAAAGANPEDVEVQAPVGTGATPNGSSLAVNYSPGVTIDVTAGNFSGGVTAAPAVPAGLITFNAKSIGEWGNSISVTLARAASGAAGKIDVTVELSGYPQLTYVARDLGTVLSDDEVDAFNAAQQLVDITDHTLDVLALLGSYSPPADYAELLLDAGFEDRSEITVTDYVGSSVALTGIHAFDDTTDITKIAAPALAEPVLDAALAAYVRPAVEGGSGRGDLIALLRTPMGLTGSAAVDYREGTGIWEHEAIDSWRVLMFYEPGLRITHPTKGTPLVIPALGDVIGVIASKDQNSGEWFSFAGPERGRIFGALGVEYNLASPARTTEFDNLDIHGLNAVVQHPNYGVVIWGNSTLQKANTLLKKAEVAELVQFIQRTLLPIISGELFNPNDTATWKSIYRKAKPFLDGLVEGRALWEYLWQGDQNADKITDAVVNNVTDLNNGEYKILLAIAPKVAMKYVNLSIGITNAGASLELVTA